MYLKRLSVIAKSIFGALAISVLAGVGAAQAQVAYDFCPAVGQSPIFSIVNGVQIWRYDPGSGSDSRVTDLNAAVTGDVNGLMVDPVRNRLLFVSRTGNGTQTQIWAYDAANGGWYAAAPAFTSPDFPRAGIAPDGTGYLIAGNSNTPAVYRVTPDGQFNYSVQNLGALTYDVAPTNTSSGDIAFDAEGVAWLSAGQDLYSVDLGGGSTSATREARPLLNGAPSTIQFAGVAFADDGRLIVANNSAPSAYYAYDPATGALTQQALTGFGGSRDLASCAFPLLAEPELSVSKTLAEVNGAPYVAGSPVGAGDLLRYAITIANSGGAVGTLFPNDVTDTLPNNTTRVAAGNDFTCVGATCRNATTVNVPANGAAVLDFIVQINTPLPAGVTAINNSVSVAGIDCLTAGNDCGESTPVGAAVSVAKISDIPAGSAVSAGDTIGYTVSVTVTNAATAAPVTITDTLGAGLTFGTVTATGAFTCGSSVTCVLPSGTVPGTYAFSYTASVDVTATVTVSNSVTTDVGTCVTCQVSHVVTPATITVAKASNPASGASVLPGDTIGYTVTVTVANSATTQPLTLTDTLDAGLTFGSVTAPGPFACAGSLSCELPAGTAPGTYVLGYTATVDAGAAGSLGNVVTATNPPGGDPDPTCATCTTEHVVTPATITVAKASNPASGASVLPGDTIGYTVTVTVANSATTQPLTLTDTLDAGLTFGSVTAPGPFACAGSLSCELPAGTAPGTYVLGYTATVDAGATGSLGNVVTATNPPGGDPDPTCATCTTEHVVTAPRIVISKTSNPGDGAEIHVGDEITYTLTVTVENSLTLSGVQLTDTPGRGLTIGTLPAGCAWSAESILCELPAGALPGAYAFSYDATVNADASGNVGNVVLGEVVGGGPHAPPECADCSTTHVLADDVALRLTKATSARQVQIGDLVRYTITVENVGALNVTGAFVTDTPPAGFSYVAGSMVVADRDDAFTLGSAASPLSIGAIDIDAGERATISYMMRVGAGVRSGTHVNSAVTADGTGAIISNVATAQVMLDADPLLEESLIFGSVFDDRDGDGWQDPASLTGLRVQGGFSPDVYVAGSTVMERDGASSAVADQSAPLLRGLDLGRLEGLRSELDSPERRQIVIRQRVKTPAFTDDFVMTTAEGWTVRMNAAGETRVERRGDAARGLSGAAPLIERRVEPGEGGYDVAYIIRNRGVEERGLPGVRIASVEGLLIETDQFGRYHLIGVPGGAHGHGRNFILKLDPATLPSGSRMTTDNPLVRRITSGLPVRFDFGVRLPPEAEEGAIPLASDASARGE